MSITSAGSFFLQCDAFPSSQNAHEFAYVFRAELDAGMAYAQFGEGDVDFQPYTLVVREDGGKSFALQQPLHLQRIHAHLCRGYLRVLHVDDVFPVSARNDKPLFRLFIQRQFIDRSFFFSYPDIRILLFRSSQAKKPIMQKAMHSVDSIFLLIGLYTVLIVSLYCLKVLHG